MVRPAPEGIGDTQTGSFILRTGESLTWYYQSQDRIYCADPGWSPVGDLPPRGPAAQALAEQARHHANACVRWQPDLRVRPGDRGISCNGFAAGPAGLVAEAPVAALRYQLVSPYRICGRYEGRRIGGKRTDSLLVRVNASARPVVVIGVPGDPGVQRAALQEDGCECFADLTAWADLHYEYHVWICLPKGQTLRGVCVDTWCGTSPDAPPCWCEVGKAVQPGAIWSGAGPVDLLLRWRHDGKLRTYRRRFFAGDMDESFIPVSEGGQVRPLHCVLSVPQLATLARDS